MSYGSLDERIVWGDLAHLFTWLKSSSLSRWTSRGLKQFWHLLLLKMFAWNFRHALSLVDIVGADSWSVLSPFSLYQKIKLRNSAVKRRLLRVLQSTQRGQRRSGARMEKQIQTHSEIPGNEMILLQKPRDEGWTVWEYWRKKRHKPATTQISVYSAHTKMLPTHPTFHSHTVNWQLFRYAKAHYAHLMLTNARG